MSTNLVSAFSLLLAQTESWGQNQARRTVISHALHLLLLTKLQAVLSLCQMVGKQLYPDL